MSYVDYSDLLIPIYKGMKVIDKMTNKEAIIYMLNPLIIEFEDKKHAPRDENDLIFKND